MYIHNVYLIISQKEPNPPPTFISVLFLLHFNSNLIVFLNGIIYDYQGSSKQGLKKKNISIKQITNANY